MLKARSRISRDALAGSGSGFPKSRFGMLLGAVPTRCYSPAAAGLSLFQMSMASFHAPSCRLKT